MKSLDELYQIDEARKRPAYNLALKLAQVINEECGPELNALRIEPFIQEILDERDKLVEALREAKLAIQFLHGEPGWAEYQHSPEMKRINAALAAVEEL